MNVKLAKLVVERGYLTLDNLKIAVEDQKNTNRPLGEILINKGFITEKQLLDLTNLDNEYPCVNLVNIDIPDSVIKLISKETAAENNLIPFSIDVTYLSVAMIDPSNIVLIDELRFLTGYNINPFITEFSNIKNSLIKYYGIDINEQYKEVIKEDSPQGTESEDKLDLSVKETPVDNLDLSVEENSTFQQDQPDTSGNGEFQSSPSSDVSSTYEPPSQQINIESNNQDIGVDEPQNITEEKSEQTSFQVSQVEERDKDPQAIVDDKDPIDRVDVFELSPSELKESREYDKRVQEEQKSQSTQSQYQRFNPVSEQESVKQETEKTESPATDFQNMFQNPAQEQQQDITNDGQNVQSAQDEFGTQFKPVLDTPEVEVDQTHDNFQGFSAPQQQETVNAFQSSESEVMPESLDQDNILHTESGGGSEVNYFNPPEQPPSFEAAQQEVTIDSDNELKSINLDNSHDTTESIDKDFDKQESLENLEVKKEVEIDKSPSFDAPTAISDHQEPQDEGKVIQLKDESLEEDDDIIRPTVLVVDDSHTVQKIVSITLRGHGYNVEVSSNALQALAKLNDCIPDIIFIDINLPHMDGYQLCKVIKSNDLTKAVPVVMLSDKTGFFDKIRGKMVGAADYITKPFEPSTLISTIEKQGINITKTI